MGLDFANLDDVVLVPEAGLSEITPMDVLQRAVALLGRLTAEDRGKSPLTVRLVDADDRCLVLITMTFQQGRWNGQIESGEIESREGIAFPWFLILEGSTGRPRRIRMDLGSEARPA
jgi:hypothetical protein